MGEFEKRIKEKSYILGEYGYGNILAVEEVKQFISEAKKEFPVIQLNDLSPKEWFNAHVDFEDDIRAWKSKWLSDEL